ncbi:transposase-like protein [Nocardiopsis mwathae]|uniref:Mutator family transposase n=1 Tax=Nocardiopsis mwathae TaxID=1472723 RepID=A0A7W9YE54_9ACTN|nr:transposase-like protein [Nocardiopsis mwathae]
MALSQHDLHRLLESLRASDNIEIIRTVLERMLQELIEAEATSVIGAEPYQRTTSRTAHRNGHRDRGLATTAGDVELKIPELRSGSFFPSLLERRRRIDRALFAVIMEAYVHGVSTRSVDDLVKALGADTGISKSEVSRICAELDEEVGAFAERPLDHTAFPYVFLDATYAKARVRCIRVNETDRGGVQTASPVPVSDGLPLCERFQARRLARDCSSPACRSLRILDPRPSCSSSGVT